MQTFLPYDDFARSAEVLDRARLGKQRVETLQILRAVALPEYGWRSHPAVRMWRGYDAALVVYGTEMVRAWTARGHGDATLVMIAEFHPQAARWDQAELTERGRSPRWLGDERLHRSHQSALVRKNPAFYRPRFPDVPDDLPYWWPEPLAPDGHEDAVDAPILWVVRPASAAALGTFLEQGVVGLGTASGVDVDATGRDAAALRHLLAERAPRRRPGKDLRQLAAFLHDVEPGDEVGVPIEGGAALLTGEVTGDYAFAAGRYMDGVRHRRAVRWHGRLPRSAVDPPSALQDPRTLFPVRLASNR